jgi:hypothetical protein
MNRKPTPANAGIVLAALAIAGIVAISGCAQVQQFTAGDLANAAALATSGKDSVGASCWAGLAPAAAASPQPSTDGFAVLAERKRLAQAAVGGSCGAVIAPALLQDVGKAVPAPGNLLLPF